MPSKAERSPMGSSDSRYASSSLTRRASRYPKQLPCPSFLPLRRCVGRRSAQAAAWFRLAPLSCTAAFDQYSDSPAASIRDDERRRGYADDPNTDEKGARGALFWTVL
jgi:hypothetical protein